MRRLGLTLAWLSLLGLGAFLLGAEEGDDPLGATLASPPATGLAVLHVVPGSQAAAQDVRAGDVVVSYDGKPTPTREALEAAKLEATEQEKETVEMLLARPGGVRVSVTLRPGPIGIQVLAVKEGQAVTPLPAATPIAFDFSALGAEPREEWLAFSLEGGERAGLEHVTLRREEGRLLLRHEVAFDGGEQWGVNHFDVTVEMALGPPMEPLRTRFESVPHGFVLEGSARREDDGRVTWVATVPDVGEEGSPPPSLLPRDLPVLPTYLVAVLARFMPREAGACLHFRPLEEGAGDVGSPRALYAVGEEEIEHGAATVRAWRYEHRLVGGAVAVTVWVGPEGRTLRADYGGAHAVATSREAALAALPEGLRLRTAR